MVKNDCCLSGGAVGSDLQWGMTAGSADHSVIHFSFHKHKTQAPELEVVCLTFEQLDEALPALKKANKTLKRSIPRPGYVRNLLSRNWYQIKDAERVYAVAAINADGMVSGGTAWATQMFIDRFNGLPCECYVFDQIVGKWFCWKGEWSEIDQPPKPYGIYAGIGSRDLNDVGKNAIRSLMEWKSENRASAKDI